MLRQSDKRRAEAPQLLLSPSSGAFAATMPLSSRCHLPSIISFCWTLLAAHLTLGWDANASPLDRTFARLQVSQFLRIPLCPGEEIDKIRRILSR